MMRAPEAKPFQHLVRIADKIAIGEEQKLYEIPLWFAYVSGRRGDVGGGAGLPGCAETDICH